MFRALAALFIGLIVVGLTLMAACAPPPPPPAAPAAAATPAPITLTDFLGRQVTLPQPARTFVSLAPSNTELLFALGLGPQVVGVTTFDDYPPEVKGIPPVGGMVDPNLEKLVALAPDLVLVTGLHEKRGVIARLEANGLRALALDPTDMEGIFRSISLVAQASGRREAGAGVVEGLRQRIEAVRTTVARTKERPRVFFVVFHDPLWTAGQKTFIHDLIEAAGGTNIFADITDFQQVSLEQVVARDPQVIIASVGHGSAQEALWQWVSQEPRLAGTAARRDGRVYSVDANLVNRPGPRIVLGLDTLARSIHPELYR